LKELIGNIRTAKTKEEMATAMEEYIIKAPVEVAIDISDLTTLPGKKHFIIEFIKEIIDTGRFIESHNFYIHFKNNLFETFKKYEYEYHRKNLQKTNRKSMDRSQRVPGRKEKNPPA
jgi:hypothetical protein